MTTSTKIISILESNNIVFKTWFNPTSGRISEITVAGKTVWECDCIEMGGDCTEFGYEMIRSLTGTDYMIVFMDHNDEEKEFLIRALSNGDAFVVFSEIEPEGKIVAIYS